MQFPILSVIVFTPIVAAILILLIPPNRKAEVRVTALAAAIFALFLSGWAISLMISRLVDTSSLRSITGFRRSASHSTWGWMG